MITLAATGHRPEKLGGYGQDVHSRLRHLARNYLAARRPDEAISGMAQGWDWAWAEAAIDLGIPLIVALPFIGQEQQWPAETQREYGRIVWNCATKVVVVSEIACARSYHLRDRWMVDHSTDEIVALWNGSPSGTAKTVVYAEKKRRPIVNLWPRWTAAPDSAIKSRCK